MADNDDVGYDEDEAESGGFFRWLQIGVVLFAVSGFLALAWYAYTSNDNVDEKNVEIIRAEKTPVREAPANPGGMQIPNQDKSVYSLITTNKNEKQVVERILPATEEPVNHDNDTQTWVSDKLKNKAGTEHDNAKTAPPANPVIVNNAVIDRPETIQTAAPVNPVVTAPSDNVPKTEPFTPPKTADTTPPVPKTPPAVKAAVPVKPVEKEEETEAGNPPPAPVKMTKAKAQLGAFKSETDANREWKKILHKFPDEVEGKKIHIMKVNIEGKGIFYRLRVYPFASEKAVNNFCAKLTSRNQGCFLAKQ